MSANVTYRFCSEEDVKTSSLEEIQKILQQLDKPRKHLLTNPSELKGYLDFFVSDDGFIQMEILEQNDNDFATVDISTASKVVEIVMTDLRVLPLRQKLEKLKINWLT